MQVNEAELLKMYKDMQTIRRMEMAADALHKAQLIRGFYHLAIGQVRQTHFCSWCPSRGSDIVCIIFCLQEAVSVALEHGISKDDGAIVATTPHHAWWDYQGRHFASSFVIQSEFPMEGVARRTFSPTIRYCQCPGPWLATWCPLEIPLFL